jgi:hypothetical protein
LLQKFVTYGRKRFYNIGPRDRGFDEWTIEQIEEIIKLFANTSNINHQLGEISCQFLPSGGSIDPRYVLQLLFCVNHKIAKN